MGISTYGSQAASAGMAKNQLPLLGKLTARNTLDSRANRIVPTTARPCLMSGTV